MSSYNSRPRIIFYCHDGYKGGKPFEAKELFGMRIFSLFGNTYSDNALACTEKGVYDLIEERFITPVMYSNFSCGLSHRIGIDDGRLYSWGSGARGELGLGPTSGKREIDIPQDLRLDKIIDITCGESFSMALEITGNVYCWGQVNIHHFFIASISFDFFMFIIYCRSL